MAPLLQRVAAALTPSRVLWAAFIVRLVVMAMGHWQDATMPVKYTDVDYAVYTDAARLVAEGRSPFERTTYRYTPLLAYLLLPNVYVHEACGKLMFVLSDLVVAYLTLAILRLRGIPDSSASAYLMAWLFHPLSVNVSTRGNADPLVCALVLLTLYLVFAKRVTAGAVAFGLAVHLKIYPVVYAWPLVLFLDNERYLGRDAAGGGSGGRAHSPGSLAAAASELGNVGVVGPTGVGGSGAAGAGGSGGGASSSSAARSRSLMGQAVAFVTPLRLRFALVSGGVFFALNAAFYAIYGYEFLFETYLYHFVRADNRHNFSVYFYDLYLRYGSTSSKLISLVAFLPQLVALVVVGARFASDLPFAVLAQTIVFVAFNKVCTAQYFLWFLCLVPLVLPTSRLPFWRGWLPVIVLWFAGEFHWLARALQLEFLGENAFLAVWVAGVLFFAANLLALAQLIRHHEFAPAMWRGKVTQLG